MIYYKRRYYLRTIALMALGLAGVVFSGYSVGLYVLSQDWISSLALGGLFGLVWVALYSPDQIRWQYFEAHYSNGLNNVYALQQGRARLINVEGRRK